MENKNPNCETVRVLTDIEIAQVSGGDGTTVASPGTGGTTTGACGASGGIWQMGRSGPDDGTTTVTTGIRGA